MKTLVIVRHGAFSHDSPMVPDIELPLNRRGRREVAVAANHFAALNITPDLVLTSPARRAQETAWIYAKKLGIPKEEVRVEEDIFEAGRAEILRIVQSLDNDCETVALFGHHPGVTLLLNHLVDSDIDMMEVGSFVVLEFPIERWALLSFKQGKRICSARSGEKVLQHGWWHFAFWRR